MDDSFEWIQCRLFSRVLRVLACNWNSAVKTSSPANLSSSPHCTCEGRCNFILVFSFFFIPIHYPRTTPALPSSSNSDPGQLGGPAPPSPILRYCLHFYREKPTTVLAFIFIASRIQRFHPSSTRVVIDSFIGSFFCFFC